jgi:hypothetical protein
MLTRLACPMFTGLLLAWALALFSAGCGSAATTAPAAAGGPEDAAVAAEVAAVFDQAIKEHAEAAQQAALLPITPTGRVGETKGFEAWRLRGERCSNRSASLEGLVEKIYARAKDAGAGSMVTYVRAAAKYLSYKEPTYRAVACEFLGHFPREAVDAGLAPVLGGMLDDYSFAFAGVLRGQAQAGEVMSRLAQGVSVADVAGAALAEMTTFEFRDVSEFRRWWGHNKDYRQRLWYWSVRWGHRIPPEEGVDWADLEGLPSEQGLRLLLLGNNEAAVVADAGLPLTATEGRETAFPIKKTRFFGIGANPDEVAYFVQRHKLKTILMAIVRQNPPWPEARSDEALEYLLRDVTPIVALAFNRTDAADLAKELENPRRVLAERSRYVLADLVRVAVDLDPDIAEGVLVAQLKREPGQTRLGVQLMKSTGLKHWDLIESSCLPSDKDLLIEALGEQRSPQAAAILNRWFTAEDWTLKLDPKSGLPTVRISDLPPLDAYIQAAALLNDGRPVIAARLRERSRWMEGKATLEQFREANKDVPAAREEVIALLKPFFAQAAKRPAPGPSKD